MNKKIILAGLLTLASVAGVVGTVGNANKVQAENDRIIFLDLWDWDNDSNAYFEAWVWGNNMEAQWISIVDGNGDGIHELRTPTGATGMKILRKDKNSHASNQWQSWNEFGNINISSNKDLFIASGWEYGNWTWSNYYFLKGSFNEWSESNPLIDDDFDGIYSTTLTLEKGDYACKINTGSGSWLGNNGSFTDSIQGWTMDGGNDLNMKANGGDYTFNYSSSNNKLSVSHKTYSNFVKELFTKYNDGSYTKDSQLNVNKLAENEIAKYFHASADTKYRRTVYSSEGLTMTTSKDGKNYSENTSAYINGDNCVIHKTNGLQDYKVDTYASVDDWFVTLNDFVNNPGSNWTHNNGVYELTLTPATATTEDTMTKMAREFVAPMWLAPNADNFAYARFNKLTVQEVGNTLVMKLYVENNKILVDGSNNVFSQVTIY